MRNHALVVIVIAACGPDSGSGSIPIDGISAAAANAFCDLYVRCGLIPDIDTCRSYYLGIVTIDADLIAAVKAGKVIYHGDKARACFDEFSSVTCDRSDIVGRSQPLSCDQTFEGTVGADGMCALNQECISQQCAFSGNCPANTCCQGTCVGGTAPVRANLGQACSTTMRCSTGFCDTATSVCTAFLADGATCTSSGSCASDLCMTTCQPLVASNGVCTNTSQCKDVGDSCNSTSKTCVPLAGLGDSCTTQGDCSSIYLCDVPTQKCVARPKVGETCTITGSCIDMSYCDTTAMKCTALKADGATCAASSECAGKQCDTVTTHTCITPAVCI